MRIIAVCLKESANVPIMGCAVLNDIKNIEVICCIDESNKMKVVEVTPDAFLNSVIKSYELDKEPEFTNFSNEMVNSESGKIKALRSEKGTTLFKKSMSSVYLATVNNIHYIWSDNKYQAIKVNASKRKSSKPEDLIQNTCKLQVTQSVFDLLSNSDELQTAVENAMVYMTDVLGLSEVDAQSFILEAYNYNSKFFGVKMHKTKLKSLLGLTRTKAKKDSQDVVEEVQEQKTDLGNYISGIENIEVTKVNSGFNPNITLKDALTVVEDGVKETIEGYNSDVSYDVTVTMERDMDGNQDVIDLKGDTTPVVNEIVDSINSQPFNEGDPNCSKCHGKGYYIENTFGIEMQVKCTCVDRYKELQHSKESTYKGKIKVNKGASLIKAMQCGLIPRRRVNDLIDFRELGDRASALCRENGETFDINDFDNYKAAMKNVLTILVANREMDYSLMLSAPNGFGKTTFVYSCIKLLLMNGKNVTPFIDLFDLAGLRLEYMSNTTWRRADDKMPGFTDTEKSIEAQAGYGQFNIKRKTEEVEDEDEEVSDGTDGTEPKPFIQMTDSEKDAYIQKMNKSYTYKDYLDSDILFCMLSVKEQAYLEISTLKAIMDYRGLRCKPTIILTDRDIEVYKTSVGMATDLYLLNDMLTKESKYATYDRALLVSVKKKRTKKLKIKPGETV